MHDVPGLGVMFVLSVSSFDAPDITLIQSGNKPFDYSTKLQQYGTQV